ncbi:uracil-DNA glycosylase family protein [Trinickia sp.]|uniref:uracil-DNA glycosylase n=1 Tax=Trinickia sp. TaxID=2571163 RepID=UPI003F802358
MPLDEAALETLGLGTLWVRRGASNGPGQVAQETARGEPVPAAAIAPSTHGAEAAQERGAGVARVEERPSVPVTVPVQAQPASSAAKQESNAPLAPPIDEPAWDDFEPMPSAMPVMPSMPDFADASSAVEPRDAGGVATLDWDALHARVSACERCRLCEQRTNTVFGVGDREADWMLIGEAPGENEDKLGEPFVGQAGKLLDSMLRALSLARGENVYIANVVKCRPPGNRNPEPDEVARCEPYLQRQVALLKPKLIVALGRVAAQNLLKTDASISSLRGRVHRYEEVPVIVTYHPAYLLRSLPDKAKAWVDLCLAHDTYRQVLAETQASR